MNKLPRLYKNEKDIPKNHNKEICYLKEEQEYNVEDTIHRIFQGDSHPFTIPVWIKTKTKEYNTYLISNKNNKLTTIDNDTIQIEDIIKIEIKK